MPPTIDPLIFAAALPPTAQPFGAAVQATALFPSLAAFLATVRRAR
jgi:hypothetical protein